ncbi:MAG: NAD+ synthase [Candidatus Thorarchaeota archaeon]
MRIIDYKKLINDIQSWIKNYVRSANAEGVVIGLSGGIDSAVTAALCVNAIGAKKVYGLSLPCESILQDIEDAELVARNLKMNFFIIDLTSVYNNYLTLVKNEIFPDKKATANLKARMRMLTLYYFGQSKGNYLVAGTGNRAELAIGYFTKYGDAGVDFEPIGNLYKGEVRQIARVLNIPERIIKKPPSPGLWAGQTDEGEIGLLYDTIDEILYRFDHKLDYTDISEDDVEKVKMMMQKAKHKLNMPPIFKIN